MTTHHFLLCKCHLQIKLIKLIFNCNFRLQFKTNYKNQSQMTAFVLAIKFRVIISRLKSLQVKVIRRHKVKSGIFCTY